MSNEPRSRWDRLSRWGLAILAILIVLSIYPAVWMTQGYRFARFCAANGLRVEVGAKIDGSSLSAQASREALDKKISFNQSLYEEIARTDYVNKNYGIRGGLSGFFFGVGTRIGRAP